MSENLDRLEIPFGPLGLEQSILSTVFDGDFDEGLAAGGYDAVLQDFKDSH